MATTVFGGRSALAQMLRTDWTELWIASPRIGYDAVSAFLPYLTRSGVRIRVMTHLTPGRLAEGKVDLSALQALRDLPGCEVRSLPDLVGSVYAVGPEGSALVTAAPLTLEGLESQRAYGTLLEEGDSVRADLIAWWNQASPISEQAWTDLVLETARQQEMRSISDEITRLGAFVRVSMKGTRRSRRLDPREFGAGEGEWGRAVRPVEVALFKLDDVIRAKDDLEAILAEHGLEWNGYYLVPRTFLERDWPRLFGARERQLRERLNSREGQAVLKEQYAQARRELEAFFGEIYNRVDSQGMDAETWVNVQTTRVLTETFSDSVLAEGSLEYRVLMILPEDARSVEELSRLLQDPKLRSVQLTFGF